MNYDLLDSQLRELAKQSISRNEMSMQPDGLLEIQQMVLRPILKEYLVHYRWNKTKVAKQLGIGRNKLYRLLKQVNL